MQVLLVIQILIAVALIAMVLIQRSESDGMGLGGGGNSGFMTGRAVANFMTRTTAILAAAFIINSLALSVLASRGHQGSIVEEIAAQQDAPKSEKLKEEAVPEVPVAGEAKASEKTEKSSVKKEKLAPKAASVEKQNTSQKAAKVAPNVPVIEEVDHNAMPATPADKR